MQTLINLGLICKDWRQMMLLSVLFALNTIVIVLAEQYFHVPFAIDLCIGIAMTAWVHCGVRALPLIVAGLFATQWFTTWDQNTAIAAIDFVTLLLISVLSGAYYKQVLSTNSGKGQFRLSIYITALVVLLVIFASLILGSHWLELAIISGPQAAWPVTLDRLVALYLGMIIITPLSLFVCEQFSGKFSFTDLNTRETIAPLSILLLVAYLSNTVGHLYLADERLEELDTIDNDLTRTVNEKFRLLEQKVRSLSKFFENSGKVSQSEFTQYVAWAFEKESNLIGFSWNKVVEKENFQAYMAKLQADYPDMAVTHKTILYPSFSTADFAVIVDKIHPFDAWKNVIGLDVMTEGNREAAILNAIESKTNSYTNTIPLVQLTGKEEQGLLIFNPSYNIGQTPKHFALPNGLAVGVVNLSALLGALIQQTVLEHSVSVEIFERGEPSKLLALLETDKPFINRKPYEFSIGFKDKEWQLNVYPSLNFWMEEYNIVRIASGLSLLLAVYALLSIINGSIRRHQVQVEAQSNSEFIRFISQIENIISSSLTKSNELHTLLDVYSSFLEANSQFIFDQTGEFKQYKSLKGNADEIGIQLLNSVSEKIKRIAVSGENGNMIVEDIGELAGNYNVVLIPWVTSDHTVIYLGFVVNQAILNNKLNKLIVLNQALEKVNEIRRQKINTDKLINHLAELNELLDDAEQLGRVGSFRIDFLQHRIYCSKQLLADFNVPATSENPARLIWQTLPFSEKKRLIQAMQSFEGEVIFQTQLSGNRASKLKVKWKSNAGKHDKRESVLGVVGDVTEEVWAEQKRQEKRNWDDFVKKSLHELTFSTTGQSSSLQDRMLIIAEKARELLDVSRASIWFFEEDNAKLVCKALATRTACIGPEEAALELKLHEFPRYFEAMRKSSVLIVPKDIATHPSTADMYKSYLQPLDIQSLADFPIIENSQVVGVICFEQQGIYWQPSQEEQLLGTSIAALLAKEIETEERFDLLHKLLGQQAEREQILSSMVDSVITIDEQGKILTANQATLEAFEYSPQEIIGSNISLLMGEPHKSQHDKYLQRYVQGGTPKIIGVGREVEGVTKSGRIIPMRLSVTQIEHFETKARIFVGVLHDLTVESAQRKRIIHSEKMDALGLMTGGIAHDFNNLLGIMLGYTEMIIESNEDPDDEISQYAKQVEIAGERAKALIAQIRTVSKTETLEQAIMSPATVAKDCKMMLEKAIVGGDVRLFYGQQAEQYQVKLNQSDFENALLNLCINAMHASQPGQEIRLDIFPYELTNLDKIKNDVEDDLMLCVSVTDHGTGMTKETQERLFEPFFSTKGDKGTGLGLAQVYGFVQRTHGFVRVNSTLGEGSVISMFLPICEQTISNQMPRQETTALSTGGNQVILVAEDEVTLRSILVHKLTSLGYTVLEAADGSEAMSLLDSHSVDLVLSDVIMPNTDGIVLANYVEDHYPQTKVQLMSGFSDMRQVNLKNEALYNNRITKPFKLRELVERVAMQLNDNS